MSESNQNQPRLISYTNYGSSIEIKINIGLKDYIYLLKPSKWALDLQYKKHFNFRDVNKLKAIGRLVSTIG